MLLPIHLLMDTVVAFAFGLVNSEHKDTNLSLRLHLILWDIHMEMELPDYIVILTDFFFFLGTARLFSLAFYTLTNNTQGLQFFHIVWASLLYFCH